MYRLRSGLSIALITVLLSHASIVRAEEVASDIPGTPWVGPSVSSSVGGPIVDRVWRLEIAEGRVAILRLAGESGSQLGLYLFDGTARSVLYDDPIKSSAKAGGTQGFVASLPAGTYYVNVNGRNVDRAYAFSLSVSLYPDLTPPTTLPRLAGGGTRVSGTTAEIEPRGYDALSGIQAVRYRFLGGEWSSWSTAVERIYVSVPSLEGPCTIEIEVRNGVGLVSAPSTLTLVVDHTLPIATSRPFAGGFSTRAQPTIAYEFDEPMQAASLNGSFVVSDFLGASVAGTVTYDAVNMVAKFVPSAPLRVGTTYAVDLVGARDLAGNLAASPGGWSFTYLLPTSMSATLSKASAKHGESIGVSGTTKGVPAGSRVRVEWRPGSAGVWTEVSAATVRNQEFFAPIVVGSTGQYRMAYDGDASHAPTAGKPLSITVRPNLQLSGAGGYVRTRSAGTTVALRGFADPSNLPMVFVRYRCNSTFTSCVRVGGETVSADADGRAGLSWVATKGFWGFRLKTASTAEYAAASTGLLKFRVP